MISLGFFANVKPENFFKPWLKRRREGEFLRPQFSVHFWDITAAPN
jgi:hypothetical protein